MGTGFLAGAIFPASISTHHDCVISLDQFSLNPDELLMLPLFFYWWGNHLRWIFSFPELPMNSSVVVRRQYHFRIPPTGRQRQALLTSRPCWPDLQTHIKLCEHRYIFSGASAAGGKAGVQSEGPALTAAIWRWGCEPNRKDSREQYVRNVFQMIITWPWYISRH